MPGEFRMEISMPRARYVFNLEAAKTLLARLEEFGEDCGDSCRRMREDLRAALALEAAGGRVVQDAEPEITEEMTVNVQRSTLDAEGVASAPRCHACGGPGRGLPAEPGDTEALWVCDAPDCWRRGMPAARRFFETGIR